MDVEPFENSEGAKGKEYVLYDDFGRNRFWVLILNSANLAARWPVLLFSARLAA
jgi:hypothetical protein